MDMCNSNGDVLIYLSYISYGLYGSKESKNPAQTGKDSGARHPTQKTIAHCTTLVLRKHQVVDSGAVRKAAMEGTDREKLDNLIVSSIQKRDLAFSGITVDYIPSNTEMDINHRNGKSKVHRKTKSGNT
jgi:hypothetical protein